jgi:L-lactate dehydrogenase complex protein LldF
VETDLGEYIIQLRGEHPSHIIAPAVHLNKEQVEGDFRRVHTHLPKDRDLSSRSRCSAKRAACCASAISAADVGITGANFLIAETGTSVIVTNEGNGDLTQTLGKVHVVVASIEKIVPTLEDTSPDSARAGPVGHRAGHERLHDVLHRAEARGRSGRAGRIPRGAARQWPFLDARHGVQDMLRCIRCGACMNHCPVYHAVGGHAYGSVYPGPMGAVLTPSLNGVDETGQLPNASTFCGRCESVCPMHIPLPKMMRHWREREFERNLTPRWRAMA